MKGPAGVRLSGGPAGFVLALAWSSSAAPVVDVVAVCSAIPTKLDLKQAYPGAPGSPPLTSSRLPHGYVDDGLFPDAARHCGLGFGACLTPLDPMPTRAPCWRDLPGAGGLQPIADSRAVRVGAMVLC